MFKITALMFLTRLLLGQCSGVYEELKVNKVWKTRCTRRFSPGFCASYVVPVWTYIFEEQNCTERLGCANHFRSNRFESYDVCIKECYGLIQVYLQLMMVNSKHSNLDLKMDLQEDETLRASDRKPEQGTSSSANESRRQDGGAPAQEQEDEIHDPSQYDEVQNEAYFIVNQDVEVDSHNIFPPDIDYVESDYDAIQS